MGSWIERVWREAQSATQTRLNALATKPPLCQERAKTGKYSPTTAGPCSHGSTADLGTTRRYGTVRNALYGLAGIYTPAVGGLIPSAPTVSQREPTGFWNTSPYPDREGPDEYPCRTASAAHPT